MNNGLFDTLGQAVDGAIHEADEARVLLAHPGFVRKYFNGHIAYGQIATGDFQIALYRDKRTSKWFHVVITRLDSGRYELVTYVL